MVFSYSSLTTKRQNGNKRKYTKKKRFLLLLNSIAYSWFCLVESVALPLLLLRLQVHVSTEPCERCIACQRINWRGNVLAKPS